MGFLKAQCEQRTRTGVKSLDIPPKNSVPVTPSANPVTSVPPMLIVGVAVAPRIDPMDSMLNMKEEIQMYITGACIVSLQRAEVKEDDGTIESEKYVGRIRWEANVCRKLCVMCFYIYSPKSWCLSPMTTQGVRRDANHSGRHIESVDQSKR
jgi:hypothetical protein